MLVKCLNCGYEFHGKFMRDELGKHCECEKCGGTFDVTEEAEKQAMERKISVIADEDAGLLGYTFAESIEYYEETGRGIIDLFQKNPESADIMNEMLIAICGWSIDSLITEMESHREYYNSL